jgi:23S rRNA pseudouridine1911/1915/1917 synthase
MNDPGEHEEVLELGPATSDEIRMRLDAWLAHRHPAISRARWQELIKDGRVTFSGAARKPSATMQAGDVAEVLLPEPVSTDVVAEDIPLDILFEDQDLIVINKPPHLVVHPAPGHASGTLVNALLFHCRDLAGIGGELRPGIVHRLDQDTSGVIVAAKNETAMNHLAAQFKDRATNKEYVALVWGVPLHQNGTIKTTIGRDPVHRKKMSTRSPHGRDAVSHYTVLQSWKEVALLRITIETGRTHQIRVHLAHIKHPVIGDTVYGFKRPDVLPVAVDRQLLHAWRLTITHPRTGHSMTFEAPWPDDVKTLVAALG